MRKAANTKNVRVTTKIAEAIIESKNTKKEKAKNKKMLKNSGMLKYCKNFCKYV